MDPVAEWQSGFERVCELVEEAGEEQLATRVPACPGWTARELLSHMIGLDADVLAGAEADDHNDGWTQAQVDARARHGAADLLAEWRGLAADLVTWMGANGTRPLGDLTIHEQDLRGALGVVGARDTGAIRIVRDSMAQRFAGRLDGLAQVVLTGDSWTWCSGDDPATAGLELRAPDFDLFRALTSRRTAEQLRGWTVRGDVADYLGVFGALGDLPGEPLAE